MARDAQLSGDRVQSEYYLQFADHYFRVLSENRARFEDQRRQRDDDSDEEDGDEEMAEASEEGSEDSRDEQPPRRDRGERRDRGDRQRRQSREERSYEGDERNGVERGNGSDERIAMDVLPPAIGREDGADEEPEQETRPRRRARRPRSQDGEGDIAPAA
jgi:hypothetical protein